MQLNINFSGTVDIEKKKKKNRQPQAYFDVYFLVLKNLSDYVY